LGCGVYVEEAGHGGCEGLAVEDAGVAEDVHEESVGTVGGVELHPLPVFASAGSAGGGMGLGETVQPGGVGADVFVRGRVEVAVMALFVAAEDDWGFGAGRDFVEELLCAGEMAGSCAKVAAEEGGGP
jgi:hypothetical protein